MPVNTSLLDWRARAPGIKVHSFTGRVCNSLSDVPHSRPPTQPLTGHSKINGRRTNSRLLQHTPPAIQCSTRYAHLPRRYRCRRAGTRPKHPAHNPGQATPSRPAKQGPNTVRHHTKHFRRFPTVRSKIYTHSLFVASCLLEVLARMALASSQSLF